VECILDSILLRQIGSRSGGFIDSVLGVSLGGGAPGTLGMVSSLVEYVINGYSGLPTEVEP